MSKTLDELTNARESAASKLHWHLSRAAAALAGGAEPRLGGYFEAELLKADKARREWYTLHDAVVVASAAEQVSGRQRP